MLFTLQTFVKDFLHLQHKALQAPQQMENKSRSVSYQTATLL